MFSFNSVPDSSKELSLSFGLRPLFASRFSKRVAALVLATGGISLGNGVVSEEANAQVEAIRDANTGSVRVDRNAFDIETGELNNASDVPLPAGLPLSTSEGQRIDTGFVDGALAPNSVNITTDFDFINQSFSEQRGGQDLDFRLDRNSLRTTTQFDLNYVQGEHQFGEGIQVRVFDENGNVRLEETRFVRGDGVTVGPNGESLPSEGTIQVEYGVDERVELRVLNLRSNNASPTESGVYFTRDGQLIAEDQPDFEGRDLDFDDGEYFEVEEGFGSANATEVSTDVTTESEEDTNPLEPEIRRESIVEEATTFTESDTVTELLSQDVVRGRIELPDNQTLRLGHALGARTEAGEQLVYDRYASVGQFRAGSDGIGATGQLRPLNGSPNAAPTLITGDVVVDPFANDNEAILGASVGITQFLSRTHRNATDAFGNPVVSPDGSRLLEPTGLFNNRRLVGYVPPRLDESAQGTIGSDNGIFVLPSDRGVVVSAPDAQAVGLGNAAYLDNVGGYIVERTDGSLGFVPQWTNEGYEQEPLTLEAGEATRIIYALVPQQRGQALRLGNIYEVESSAGGYRITDGGFTVIAADQYPENFFQESNEVYTVEDTLPTIENAATATFNGVRGVYVEPDSTVLPTVDPDLPAEADARVGNLLSPLGVGQLVYGRTTRAAGFYLGGALMGGFGNQSDTTRSVVSTTEIQTDRQTIVERINTFSTPVDEVTSTDVEVTTTTTRDGVASFVINRQGEGRLSEVNFVTEDEGQVARTTRDLGSSTERRLGEEALIDSNTQTRTETLGQEIIEQDVVTNDSSDSFVNAAPVMGEIALGGVLNFGNTPWTPAANTLRAELFAQETIFGRGDDSDFGWRAELMFYPFGEKRREGYQYDESGNVVPLYQTEPVMENGEQVIDTLVAADGTAVEVPVNQFVLDENGDRIPLKVGTGRSNGPGFYVRVEGEFDDDDNGGAAVDGGIQLTF